MKPAVAVIMTGLLLVATSPAFSQSVQQSGSVTPNHVPAWITSGVIGDGGTAADSPITSFGVTSNTTAGICVSSGRATAAGRQQLCLGSPLSANAVISLQNYGTATAKGLNFVINGVTSSLPSTGGDFVTATGPYTTGGIPCFDGTASAAVHDCGNLGLGTMSTQNANAVAITGGSITGMPAPSVASDVATKSYVDATSTGLNILAPSALATAAVLPNTPTYANGTLGVGATLTAGSNTTLTVDGTSAPLNTVVLVKNQASALQNGIYKVTQAGSGSVPWILTRATYFDQAAEMLAGSYTFITSGATNINSAWTLQTAVTTVGTDALTFVQFSSTGTAVTSAIIAPGAGISATGTCTITSTGTCTVAQALTNATVQANPSNPTSTTSTVPVMMGLGTSCHITPVYSGRVKVEIIGILTNGSPGNPTAFQVRYGVGTVPANGDPIAGTQIGNRIAGEWSSATLGTPAYTGGIITGLSTGVAIWFDAAIDSIAGSGAQITSISCNAMEF